MNLLIYEKIDIYDIWKNIYWYMKRYININVSLTVQKWKQEGFMVY